MQVAKTAATGRRSEHCCHTLLHFLLPSVEETTRQSQSAKPPPAAPVPRLQVCQAAYETKRRLKSSKHVADWSTDPNQYG